MTDDDLTALAKQYFTALDARDPDALVRSEQVATF